MIVTCASCKAEEAYTVDLYIHDLAVASGINDNEDYDTNFKALLNWNVLTNDDYVLMNKELDYAFLAKTICNLIEEKGNPLNILKDRNWLKSNVRENGVVKRKVALEVIDNAVKVINNKEFDNKCDYTYKKKIKDSDDELDIGDVFYDGNLNKYYVVIDTNDEGYVYEDAQYDDVFSYMDVSGSYEIDFSEAEIIPLQEEENTSYRNNIYNLLASKNHVFNSNGFRISYTVSGSSIDVHVSKDTGKSTIYADASINKVKPTFKWTYEKDDLKNCYFKLGMNTTNSIGATIGKYGNYYLKFKDLDSTSFESILKSMVVPKEDEVDVVIPICEIKVPLPNLPVLKLDMTVGIKLYISGRVEIVLYNTHNIGFEIKNGNGRFFWEHDDDDLDAIARSSAKTALALNLGLDAADYRLCDIELDGGLKAEVKATMHLYDSDFVDKAVESDYAYSVLEEVSANNPNVKICGDVSLYWLLDLVCNTSKSALYKMGLTKTFHILDEDNQVFGNLHHIEDGQFVKKCTRQSKPLISNENIEVNSTNKILLNTYAEVMSIGNEFKVEITALPKGYTQNDIRYSSSNSDIAIINNSTIKALKAGTSKIKVYTSDNKYNSYINILVSTD